MFRLYHLSLSAKISRGILRRIFDLTFLAVIVIFATASTHAAGEVDRSFKGSLLKTGTGQVYRSVLQPDGKIIITGDFNVAVTEGRTNIARLNADGSLDTTFNPPAIVGSIPPIRSIVLQADGKIVIGGYFSRGVRRLNPDGSDDTAFNNNPFFDNQTDVDVLDILPDGRIIYAGDRSSPNRNNLTVLSAGGSVISDESPTSNVTRLAVQPDGKIIVFDGSLRRLNPDLSIDADFIQVVFGASGGFTLVSSIIVQPDGKIVVSGGFNTVNGGSLSGMARINPNGTVDTTFNLPSTAAISANALAYLPDGKILAGGLGFNGVTITLRLNTDGTRDNLFAAPTGFNRVDDLDIQIDGRIIVSGQVFSTTNIPGPIIRLNVGGSLDSTFSGPVGKSGNGIIVKVLPDDKFLVGGDFNFAGGLPRSYLARFNSDGTIDPTFSQTTITTFPNDVEVYPDGKVVVSTITTFRLNTDGTRDTSWNDPGGATYDILPLSDGRTLVARSNGAIQRLTSSGTVDPTFSTTTLSGRAFHIQLQTDGRILVGGDFTGVNGTSRSSIARLNANGGLDASFNLIGGTNGNITDIDLQGDGKILVAGRFTSIGFVVRFGLARLNADGSLDAGFAPVIDSYVEGAKIMPDGKIVIGGTFTHVDGLLRVGYARLLPDGGLDGGFTGPGSNGAITGLDTQSDGKIIMAGNFSLVENISAPGIVRVVNGASVNKTFCDYDGDGRSDVSVFRPSNGAWYLQRSHAGFYGISWGLPTDKITPGDYDGDGKTDVAVYRPSTGVWYVFNSGNGTVSYYVFGIAEDLPVPADYDGDGKSDIAVFRPSTGTWYRQNSSNGAFFGVKFGIGTDKPTLGDFDGDGKADIAVYRPSNGYWYRINSSNGTSFLERFGDSTDIPVAADYDADGKTDLAVFHPSNGNWIFKRSSASDVISYAFGISTDIPTPGDFDGDGKADPAVFRPSTGNWYRANSASSSITGLRFGTNGDQPTQAAFRY